MAGALTPISSPLRVFQTAGVKLIENTSSTPGRKLPAHLLVERRRVGAGAVEGLGGDAPRVHARSSRGSDRETQSSLPVSAVPPFDLKSVGGLLAPHGLVPASCGRELAAVRGST
jgi:hypothetical protein